MNALRRIWGDNTDVLLVVLVLGVITILFAPIPAGLLDFLILSNVSFALLVLLLTFYRRSRSSSRPSRRCSSSRPCSASRSTSLRRASSSPTPTPGA